MVEPKSVGSKEKCRGTNTEGEATFGLGEVVREEVVNSFKRSIQPEGPEEFILPCFSKGDRSGQSNRITDE